MHANWTNGFRVPKGDAGESGLSLISVIIAFSMFVAVLAPAAALLQQGTLVSGNVQNQIIAANLATKQLELIRSQADYSFATLVDNYLGTTSTTVPIGSTTYTLTQTLEWQPGNYSAGGCGTNANGNASLQPVLTATTTVSWPSMNALQKPATVSTFFTPPVGQYSANSGDISVQVLSATGSGQSDIPVTVTGPSGGTTTSTTVDTDSQGCAFFPFLAPGSYTASLTSPSGKNYVDPSGNGAPSTTLGVVTGTIATYQFSYDQAAALTLPAPNDGYSLPGGFGVTLASPNLPGLGTIVNDTIPSPGSNGSITFDNLFPFPSGYDVWVGSCYTYQQGAGFSGVTASGVTPGSTTTAKLAFAPVQIEVVDSSGNPVAGAQVSVNVMDPSSGSTPPYDVSCPGTSSTNYQFTAVPSTTAGQNLVEVPVGYLQFVATSGSATGTYPLATASTPYVDLTSGTGGPIVITLS